MLIIERQSNGSTVVKIKKDWNPSRIGKAYTPPHAPLSKDAYRLQTALLEVKEKENA
jgi:hypothetical protein